ncbi:MAG: hypothetical protein L0312_02205, partial [Acidobacteria bacterium]|nr:hypothetical protein [Acidobacteriota bacterium]
MTTPHQANSLQKDETLRACLAAKNSDLWTCLETSLIYSLVQIYIWRWQYTWPKTVWLILLLLLASHLWHRDTLRGLGFRLDNFATAVRQTSWAAIPLLLLLVLIGILSERLWAIPLRLESVVPAMRYALWGTFQQYGSQGYFHHRLLKIIPPPLWSSTINAVIFMTFHIPNPVLMIFTLLGGFACSILYL